MIHPDDRCYHNGKPFRRPREKDKARASAVKSKSGVYRSTVATEKHDKCSCGQFWWKCSKHARQQEKQEKLREKMRQR